MSDFEILSGSFSTPTNIPAAGSKNDPDAAIQEAVAAAGPRAIQAATTAGGHGGMVTIQVQVEGKTHNLFLKPVDKAEKNNYQFLQENAKDSLKKFLPHMYGDVKIGDTVYLILDDVTKPANTILLDAKLSGGKIAEQAEMKATRGKKKNRFDFQYMKLSQMTSPDFMISKSGVPRPLRVLFYPLSKNVFEKTVGNAKSPTNLAQLQKELEELQAAMKESPMAFIGASILILHDKNSKEFTVKLVDPAHGQINPDTPSALESLYKGRSLDLCANQQEFQQQLDGNLTSIHAMIDIVEGMSRRATASRVNDTIRPKSEESKPSRTTKQRLTKAVSSPRLSRINAILSKNSPSTNLINENPLI